MESTTDTADLAFTIRDFRAADFDRLWEIDQLCFAPGIAYTQMELSGFISARNAITLIAQRRDSPNSPPVVHAADTNHIAGFLVAHPIRRRYGRILTLDVLPEARRTGIASGLMNAGEARLRAMGCSEVYLETAVNNDAALRLYRKLGYRILRTLPEYYTSHSLDAFQMGKML